MKDKWKHLFSDGEFARRERILSGLNFEQVTTRPSPQSHPIYEELWHANRWQSIVVNRDEALYEGWQRGEVYPAREPASAEEWDSLVAEFLTGTGKALWWTESPERLAHETEPGSTMEDALHSLAIHNAYHMGKVVALRQQLNAWEVISDE